MKTVMILDPALVIDDKNYTYFNDGLDNNVFIKWPNGTSPDEELKDVMIGYVYNLCFFFKLIINISINSNLLSI